MRAYVAESRRLMATAIFALLVMASLAVYGWKSAPAHSAASAAARPSFPVSICAPHEAPPDPPMTSPRPR